MKKFIAAVILASTALATPALAANAPVYAGLQIGDDYVGFLGGYQLDQMYSAEISYIDGDNGTNPFGDIDFSSIGVAGVAMFPVKPKGMSPFSLFAKAGFERATVKVRFAGGTRRDTDTNLVLGGGAQHDFNSNVSARLGVDIEGEADSLYLSAIYKF